MPACSKVLNLLVEYLERRLPADTQAELDKHLNACSSCVAQLRTYKSTISLLHSLREEDLPAELRLTLHAFLDQRANN